MCGASTLKSTRFYDQSIINLGNNNQTDSLVLEDIPASVLNKDNIWKNKEGRQVSSQQDEALLMTRGRSTEHSPSGSIIIIDQNQEVRRMSNATIVIRNDISRKSVRKTSRVETIKLSHQMLRVV